MGGPLAWGAGGMVLGKLCAQRAHSAQYAPEQVHNTPKLQAHSNKKINTAVCAAPHLPHLGDVA